MYFTSQVSSGAIIFTLVIMSVIILIAWTVKQSDQEKATKLGHHKTKRRW